MTTYVRVDDGMGGEKVIRSFAGDVGKDECLAMRYRFAHEELPELRYAVEPDKPPPVIRAATRVRFRLGQNVETYVREFAPYKYCEVEASMGVGKSTDIPRQFQVEYGLPVLHLCPGELKALSLNTYLVGLFPGYGYRLATEQSHDVGDKVTHASGAWAMGHYLCNKHLPKPFGDIILYLDEAHEDDLYTEWFRTVAVNIPGVMKVVMASGTFSAEGNPTRTLKGDSHSEMYTRVNPDAWNIHDVSRPWSVTSFTGNTLIFLDDQKLAERLVAEYSTCGFLSYRLHSRMDMGVFQVAVNALKGEAIVVLIADSSFRSCFTFDVDRIIDPCLVGYKAIENGRMVQRYRLAYEPEHLQAGARGGRVEGSKCVVYRPNVQLELAMSSLTALDMDTVAVLYRVTGFAIPTRLAGAATSTGMIPKEIGKALNGYLPFVLLEPAALVSPVFPSAGPEESGAVDLLASYTDGAPLNHDVFGSIQVDAQAAPSTFGSAFDVIEAMALTGAAVDDYEFGLLYACHGVDICDHLLPGYGSDWELAMQEMLKREYLALGLSERDKSLFLGKFLLQYNSAVSYLQAADKVFAGSAALVKIRSVYPVLVRDWARQVQMQMTCHKGAAQSLLRVIKLVKPTDKVLSAYDSGTLVDDLAAGIVARLKTACDASQQAIDVEAIDAGVRGVVGLMADADVKRLELAGGTSGGDDSYVMRNMKTTCRPCSAGMWELTLEIPGAASLSVDAFVKYVQLSLKGLSLSVANIRTLTLLGTAHRGTDVLAMVVAATRRGTRKRIAFG